MRAVTKSHGETNSLSFNGRDFVPEAIKPGLAFRITASIVGVEGGKECKGGIDKERSHHV